jgi:tRNA dimethylallyltransferase
VNRVPVIAGPTAGGKTALGVALALRLAPAEIVSADSMLLYRGLDIGTAKPTAEERRGVPHHLIDICGAGEAFSVHDWLRAATAAIADLRSRGAQPVVVGGTHLYIKALLDGLFEGPAADPALRDHLRSMEPAALRAELERVDPDAARRLHPNDTRRTIRAIEVFRATGRPISALQTQWDAPAGAESAYLLAVLHWPTEALNRRINDRVRAMIAGGFVEEARGLWRGGVLGPQAGQALGYKQLIEHFEGRCSLEDAVERIKIETRRFAKNQRTWLRRLSATPGVVIIPHDHPDPVSLIAERLP